MPARIHILGASGTGTSTLARHLANRLGTQAFDTDDFYWLPTDPPFMEKRPVPDRLDLMREIFLPRADWVLAGALVGWGAPVVPRLTHVVFLTLDPEVRIARLRAREARRYGDAIKAGGSMEAHHRSFITWALSYDDAEFTGRSLRQHQEWLARLTVPVIRLNAAEPPETLADAAEAMLGDSPSEMASGPAGT